MSFIISNLLFYNTEYLFVVIQRNCSKKIDSFCTTNLNINFSDRQIFSTKSYLTRVLRTPDCKNLNNFFCQMFCSLIFKTKIFFSFLITNLNELESPELINNVFCIYFDTYLLLLTFKKIRNSN